MFKILCVFLIFVFTSCNVKEDIVPSYGLVFDEQKYSQVPLRAMEISRSYEEIPSAVSLKKYAPIPGNQNPYGTCTAWSSTYGARTIMESIALNRTDKKQTTKNVFSPLYTYKSLSNDSTCRTGLHLSDVISFLTYNGVPKRLEQESYSNFANYSLSNYSNKDKYSIADYNRLFDASHSNFYKIQAIKKSIAEKRPVVIGMRIFSSFIDPGKMWSVDDDGTDKEKEAHAMVIVGYDDMKFGGSFEVMNSWGVDWADGGFVWIPYNDLATYVFEAYELIEDLSLYSNLAEFDAEIEIPVWGESQNMPVEFMPEGYYRSTKAYESGTQFQLFITTNEPSYVYAFASDEATKKTTPIFPYEEGISALMDYSKSTIAYPAEDAYIQMDSTAGTDYIVVLFSKKKLNLTSIMKAYEQSDGGFVSRVTGAVGSNFMKPLVSNYSSNKIKFSVSTENKYAVTCLLIAIDHT